MPIYSLTVDDSDPVIRYSAGWQEALAKEDGGTVNYQGQTFHGTHIPNEFAQFSFYGTGVQVFGSTWFNHDMYAVTVDGSNTLSGNGNSTDRMYKQPLAVYSNIALGSHEVVLTNIPRGPDAWVDLDYIMFSTGDGDSSTPAIDTVLDDTVAGFTYDASWSNAPNGLSSQYYAQTFHSTNVNNAKATLKFEGNAIALYGATSGNHGLYSVAVDNQMASTYNGSARAFRAQRLLFWAGGLTSGSHTLTVTNLGSGPNGYLDLDRAVVTQWGSPPGSAPPTSSPTNTPIAAPAHKSNVGAIAGGVAGGIGAVLLALLMFFMLRRRRAKRSRNHTGREKIDIIGHGEVVPALARADSRTPHRPVDAGPVLLGTEVPPPAYDAPPRHAAGMASLPADGSASGGTSVRATLGSPLGSSRSGFVAAGRPLPSPPASGATAREKGGRFT